MSDWCWECLVEVLHVPEPQNNDMAGLCEEGEMVGVLCEGCGFISVDHLGHCLNPDDHKHGHELDY